MPFTKTGKEYGKTGESWFWRHLIQRRTCVLGSWNIWNMEHKEKIGAREMDLGDPPSENLLILKQGAT